MTASAAAAGARRVAVGTVAGATGLAAGAALGLAQGAVGPGPALLCIAGAAAGALVARPAVTVATLGAAVVLFEADSKSMFGTGSRFYRSVGGFPVSALVVLLVLATLSVALRLRQGRWIDVLPIGFCGPLGLIGAATVPAAMTGLAAGANRFSMLSELVSLAALVIAPMLFTWGVRNSFGVRRAAVAVSLMGAAKAVEGLVSWVLGAGRPLGDTTITFYEPTPLFLLLLCILATLAALVTRAPLSRWTLVAAVLALAALVLSLRRGFWVAATLGIALCLLVASGRRGRALLVPAAVILSLAIGVAVRSGGATDNSNVAVERARSLAPSRLALDDEDRYRLEEQANVRTEVLRHPVTGLGLAVPWRARVPLSLERPGGRLYTHFVILWYWMKLGVLGAVGYVWLIVNAARVGGRIWREHPDAAVRAAGLACAVGFVGLAVVETTASFTGVSPRFTVAAGAVIGWLSVAGAQAGAGRVQRNGAVS